MQACRIAIVAAVEAAVKKYRVIMLRVEDFNRSRFVVVPTVAAERDD